MHIEIKCTAADTVNMDLLKNFQGKLKKISKENLEKIKKQIVKNGFSAPIFAWEKMDGKIYILDGHQRLKALQVLQKEGYEIPPLPVAYIDAADEQEAREKLLAISSQYGEFDMDELTDWLGEYDKEMSETLRLVDSEIDMKTERPTEEDDSDMLDKEKDNVLICPYCGGEFKAQKK